MSLILTPEEAVAEYIIQVNTVFRPGVTNILGSFNLWAKGGQFGRGDELLKFCPQGGCKGFFTDTFKLTAEQQDRLEGKDFPEWPRHLQEKYVNWFNLPVMCDKCGTLCVRESLPDSYGFNMGSQQIAERMAEFFTLLAGNADIYMVRSKGKQLFHNAREELYSVDKSFSRYQKKIEKARDRDCIFYPLKSILKDTSSGGDLTKRFKALIEA